MQGLILETSGPKGSIILCQDGLPVEHFIIEGGPALSKNLGLHVQRLLAAHPGFSIEFVAVGSGPGSYTGIRVGVSLARAIAFGSNVPIVYFCSLEAFAPTESGSFAILADARIAGIYCLMGTRTEATLSFEQPSLVSPATLFPKNVRLASYHPEQVQTKLSGRHTVEIAKLNPSYLADKCTNLALTEPLSPLIFSPLSYLSSPDTVFQD